MTNEAKGPTNKRPGTVNDLSYVFLFLSNFVSLHFSETTLSHSLIVLRIIPNPDTETIKASFSKTVGVGGGSVTPKSV